MHRGSGRLAQALGVMIELCASVEQPGWLFLRQLLWPHCTQAEHLAEMRAFVAQPDRYIQFMAYGESYQAVGFVEASLRNDYVNGTESSPVAFLEGLYVVPRHRRRGIARCLVAAIGEWAAAHGCHEFASDAPLKNELSQAVHKALGFMETERVVYFRKVLSANDA